MTSRTKNMLLVSGFVLALLVCYQFALSNTLAIKKQYKNLKSEETLFKNTPKQLTLLKQKQVYFDSILAVNKLHSGSIQNNLLKTINAFAETNTLKVINFSEPHFQTHNDLTIKTYEFTLEGNYNDILSLIHRLEQQTKFGEIINLHFEKKKNYRTGKHYLQARVLLRSFA